MEAVMKIRTLFACLAVLALCAALLCGCSQPVVPDDGSYTAGAVLSGSDDESVGVASPAAITITDGQIYAHFVFTGASFDTITADGKTYEAEADGGFTIPIKQFDIEIPVTADGADYTVLFDFGTFREAE